MLSHFYTSTQSIPQPLDPTKEYGDFFKKGHKERKGFVNVVFFAAHKI